MESIAVKLLDLYCCAGGAGYGYKLAGFHVTGVDINPQPRYAGDVFVQGDALEYVSLHGHEYDVIHASPPCQRFSIASQCVPGLAETYPDLVGVTRDALTRTGKPYVIENVPNAPFTHAIMLCGTMFGLHVYRHRLFECFPFFMSPSHGQHSDNTPKAGTGLVSRKGFISVAGTGGPNFAYKKLAMGIDWMNRHELSEAIPPAYTEFIGRQILERIELDRTEWSKNL